MIGGKATVGDVALFNIMDLHVRIFGEQLKEQVCSTERWVALIGAAGCCWLPAAGCLACAPPLPETHSPPGLELPPQYPDLVAYHGRIAALPGLKEYLASSDRPEQVNGNKMG